MYIQFRLINPKTKGHIPSPVYGPVNLPSPVYGPAKRVIGTAVSASQFNPQYANPPIDDNLVSEMLKIKSHMN